MDDSKKEGVRVEDRRHFDREGNPLNRDEESSNTTSATAVPPEEARVPPPPSSSSPPPVDFIALVVSFTHTALIHLGELEDPVEHKVSEDLPMARQMIDTLELLQQKTKGNLSPEEAQVLESALFDLRMRFMQRAKILK